MCTYVCVRLRMYVSVFLRILRMCVYFCVCTFLRMLWDSTREEEEEWGFCHTRSNVHTYAEMYIHTQKCACMHRNVNTSSYAHTEIHTHIYTQTPNSKTSICKTKKMYTIEFKNSKNSNVNIFSYVNSSSEQQQ